MRAAHSLQRVNSSSVGGPVSESMYPPMSVVKPNAPPTARLSMSGPWDRSPEPALQSTVSSPGKVPISYAALPGRPL